MIEIVDVFGYAGMVTAVSFLLPQVYRTYQTKSVEDVSWGMLVLLFLNFFFWLVYGILSGAPPISIANGIALIVSVVQITLKVLYRNNP